MRKTVIIVQARMTSTRLPGKVLLPLAGKPMLSRLIERLRLVGLADALVIATTTNAKDDVIADLCQELKVSCHRGSESDVLLRYAEAAQLHFATEIVRVTADCPLIDPMLVDKLIAEFRDIECDYVSNMHPPTWPYGMAIEVFSAAVLEEANIDAKVGPEREHVTPYIYWRPERYRIRNVESPENLSHHRWTVDTLEDYQLVTRLFDAVYSRKPNFSIEDVLEVIRANPKWVTINQHVRQVTI